MYLYLNVKEAKYIYMRNNFYTITLFIVRRNACILILLIVQIEAYSKFNLKHLHVVAKCFFENIVIAATFYNVMEMYTCSTTKYKHLVHTLHVNCTRILLPIEEKYNINCWVSCR